MKHNKYTAFLIGVMALLGTVACTDSYEDLPVNTFSQDYVFSKTDSLGEQAHQFLNYIYQRLRDGHNGVGSDYLDAASDDAISIAVDEEPAVYRLQTGAYTASNRVTADMIWGDYYAIIRYVNILIANVDVVPISTTYTAANGQRLPLNYTYKAEARFIRAYTYFNLLERYGGIPLMGDKVYTLEDDIELARNTFEECVEYIVSELDAIKDDLRACPIENADLYAHVPTREACMALKARVLLYAASPLFNGSTLEQGNALVGYPNYDVQRWKRAADAARFFIENYGEKGNGTFRLASNFKNPFLGFYSNENPEMIFYRSGGQGTGVENNNGPLGFSGNRIGQGRTNPTQNLVDAFLMKDGHFRGESPKYSYDTQHPYDNRDPRLDYTVLHTGSLWLNSTLNTAVGGGNNPGSVGRYSRTTYYMRKFMGNFEQSSEYSGVWHQWVVLRYTEVLLNFAEAENEHLSAPSQEVYDVIISLRKRAGIEAGEDGLYGLTPGMTQAEMRRVIQNERRLELAFEEHRYWDIRRWKIAKDAFADGLMGMQIVSNLGSLIYTPIKVYDVTFAERMYLYPIPYSEVNKNSNMVQNPKW